jgi:glycosyltransferase involved in cell wall biosynthesis
VLFGGSAMDPEFQGGEPILADLLVRGLQGTEIEIIREGRTRTLPELASLALTPFDVDPMSVRRYRRRIREIRPDVVLAFVDYDCSLVVAARKEGVPVAVCIQIYWPTCPVGTHYIEGQGPCYSPGLLKCIRHVSKAPISPNLDLPVPSLPAPIALLLYLKLLERPAALSQADVLIANSEFTASVLRRAGYERVQTIHNGVDTSLFEESTWSGPTKTVLFPVARSKQERKGYLHFVEMARAVREVMPEVRFRILNDPGDALFDGTPYLTHLELAELYRSVYLAVVPSVWDEPFGFVTIEAMSAGRPVVGYRVGAMPEIIEDGVSGRLVERGSVRGLTEAVLTLLREEETARKMGHAGRTRVEQRFDYRVMAGSYRKLLRKLVAGTDRASPGSA